MTEVERVVEAMEARSAIDPVTMEDVARAAIAALDAYRAEERRKNCQHLNKTGTGMVGSDGSSYYDWYCRDCHASGHSETPARPATETHLLMNGDVGGSST